MVSKIKFFSVFVHVYDKVSQREEGSTKYNTEINEFFERNNVLKWETIPAMTVGGSCIDPTVMVEYES